MLGGLTVASITALDLVIILGASGVQPGRVFQGIAARLIGREAIHGGFVTIVLGLGLHLVIASSIVAIVVIAAQRLPGLVRRPFIAGPVYGVGVFLVLDFVSLPLTSAPLRDPQTADVLNGLFIHIVGVGIPAALFARSALRQRGWHRYGE